MIDRPIAQACCASGNDNRNTNSARNQTRHPCEHERASETPRNRRGGATVPSSKAELGSRAISKLTFACSASTKPKTGQVSSAKRPIKSGEIVNDSVRQSRSKDPMLGKIHRFMSINYSFAVRPTQGDGSTFFYCEDHHARPTLIPFSQRHLAIDVR